MIQEKYAIIKDGKYLTNLFEDEVKKVFQSADISKAYKWDIRKIAENVAAQYDGAQVVILHYK